MANHLFKRGGRYFLRRRVPLDLVAHFGRKEFQRALGTSERHIALIACRSMDLGYDVMFSEARAAISKRGEDTPAGGTDGSLSNWAEIDRGDPDDNGYRNSLEEERCRRVAEFVDARLRATMIELGLVAAPVSQDVVALPATPVAAPSRPDILEAPARKSLGSLVEIWEKARQPGIGAAMRARRTVAQFSAMVGNIPVPKITKLQIVEFRDKLIAVQTGPTALEATLQALRSLLNFAMGQAWININPAAGVKVEGKKKNAKAARPPFDVPTLNRIFAGRVYSENFRTKGCGGEAVYWLPLLGLYTGARVEELAQLRPEDIYEDSYIDAQGTRQHCWVLRITDNEEAGQEIKNSYSRRRIPIHRELLARGFIDFVKGQAGQRRIFTELKADGYGLEGAKWSQWWLRHIRRECAPSSPKMVFHSFRHAFKDFCRECGISKDHADALQGHSEGDAAGNYGGEFYPLRPLVEAMNKYHVAGVTLPA